MANSETPIRTILVSESMSTKAAQEVLVAETRAFGNKAAKAQLQMATAHFAHAKQVANQSESQKTATKENK